MKIEIDAVFAEEKQTRTWHEIRIRINGQHFLLSPDEARTMAHGLIVEAEHAVLGKPIVSERERQEIEAQIVEAYERGRADATAS